MPTRIASPLLPTLLAMAASLLLTASVLATETTLTADLADAGAGDSDGSGTASITVDPDTGEACWDLAVENIGDVVASHIHVGAAGEEGEVVVPLDIDGFSGSSSDCVDASDADLDAILADPAGYYVNIHTADFPNGAIRGQLTAGPPDTAMAVPTSSPSVGVGFLLVAAAGLLMLRSARRRA